MVEAVFEAQCGCDLVFESAGDGAAMLVRLMLTGERSKADIVLSYTTSSAYHLIAEEDATKGAASALLLSPEEAASRRDAALDAWRNALAR